MRIYVSWLADFYEEGVVVTSPVQLKVLCQCLWAFAELDDILESREVSLLFHLYIYIYVDLVFVLPPRAATPIDGFTQPADRFDGSDLAAANILQTSKILTSWKGDSEFVSRLWQQVVRRRA
jgi:hypothetical protein